MSFAEVPLCAVAVIAFLVILVALVAGLGSVGRRVWRVAYELGLLRGAIQAHTTRVDADLRQLPERTAEATLEAIRRRVGSS